MILLDLPQEVVAAVEDLPAPPAAQSVEVAVAEDRSPDAAAPEPAAASPVDAVEAVVGAPVVEPFDAVYAKLRAGQGTNILEHAEREIIARALEECGGKQVRAAEILGMTRATLRKRIDQYDLGK